VLLATEAWIARRASHDLSRCLRTGRLHELSAGALLTRHWMDRPSSPCPVRQESVSLSHPRSEATWENGSQHNGSPGFADTEEVTGSNPVAPTMPALIRESVHLLALLGMRLVGEYRSSGRESVQVVKLGVHLRPLSGRYRR
jgi:hypothetical protein